MKTIHILQIIDKSGSMLPYRNRTIEGINDNINTLKREVDKDTEILNTQLQFSAENPNWTRQRNNSDTDFRFIRVGQKIQELPDMVEKDYVPAGGTPLLDAIGYGIEKVKDYHGDKLGDENLKIIVTVFSDGEENCSVKYTNDQIKKIIEHFQADGRWTFTFIGCGSFENVSKVSGGMGILQTNTVNYVATDAGTAEAFDKISTSYTTYTRAVKRNKVDADLFKKQQPSTK